MGFEWKSFVAVSRLLSALPDENGAREARLRSAISRAYYGAFCYSRNYARDWLGFSPRYDAEDHGRLRAHLKKSKRWRVSEKLERLRDWRRSQANQNPRRRGEMWHRESARSDRRESSQDIRPIDLKRRKPCRRSV